MDKAIKEKQKRIKMIFSNKRILYNLYNYPITNYLHLFKDNRIYIPDYQRGLVWDQEQKELLIESIMINMPIGNIFLNDRGDLTYEIVDGQQRLTTIWDFYNNKFTWNGLLFKDLPMEFQTKLELSSVIATYVTQYKHRRNIIELYYRINWAGVEHSVEDMLAIDQERDDDDKKGVD